ncbi:hypothetical protein ABB37_03196 [Leptomonas pyrrhocoris]|uniref:AAA+ ATPase domain-containing protein n=1 Tax=Leptomonas pyrrhocoris TaxID=157538 RepID=A0A0N0DWU0_LEPPY|nr:hypothetical protein ABB37_03196 [Leptomonas pyrrhocoris]KPA82022.1 hypothetical protein ABB37_03196 [Leptomonas pyrrhocoris]|eukprot:XP_015660461.1 hypothetical protein ABB37_03196 [Leptomonas pyrrhocoris]
MERQIATVTERVYPNRIVLDGLMIHSIMGYVSHCYLRTLRQGANACDAVSIADYEYSFIYENVEEFDESWVPYSTRYKSLFGRVIASAMELSVMPTIGQAIQVEPGLFVRSLEDKHRHRKSKENESGSEEDEASSGASHRTQGSGERGLTKMNRVDKLNQYVFYDMRKYAENMDEHAQPPVDGNADDISSAEHPFDQPAQNRRKRHGKQEGKGGSEKESTQFDNDENPKEETFIVIEYRRPLPYERSQALCHASNTPGVAVEYDETRAAGDVIEGFLARAHGWYLGHAAQRKTTPLMAIYPSSALPMFAKSGVAGLRVRREWEGDFSGRCYVFDSASLAAETVPSSSSAAVGKGGKGQVRAAGSRMVVEEGEEGEADNGIAAGVTIGPSTLSGGHVGLGGSADSVQSMGKTFKSLFFPSKAHVLSVIDDFVQERGRYGVPGVVARLNLFLYGAPGTGKTSFVKALARHLRRNLVVVSMSEILTVDELQKLLQPFELAHTGDDHDEHRFSVRPHQSIYVFEDFDAIGDAWEALMRDQSERKTAQAQQAEAAAARKEATTSETNEDDTESSTGTNRDEKGSEEDSAEDTTAAGSREEKRYSASSKNDKNSSPDDDDGGDSDDDSSSSSKPPSKKSDSFVLEDERLEELDRVHLTVERFLDLFNGFNLPDSFIAVFTTNHPERVHPRITSTNMMDITLDMGMLNDECATEMIEHYFVNELTAGTAGAKGQPHLTTAQVAELHAALEVFNRSADGVSGALLENMCIECDTVASLTQRLRAADTWDIVNAF